MLGKLLMLAGLEVERMGRISARTSLHLTQAGVDPAELEQRLIASERSV